MNVTLDRLDQIDSAEDELSAADVDAEAESPVAKRKSTQAAPAA